MQTNISSNKGAISVVVNDNNYHVNTFENMAKRLRTLSNMPPNINNTGAKVAGFQDLILELFYPKQAVVV